MESEEKKMSYYTLSNKELSQLIRKDLKKHGFLKKDYSIRVRDCTYDTSVSFRIKNPLVRISEIEEITKKYKSVYYDEYSQEILAGGNVYLHCQYESGIFDAVTESLHQMAEKILDSVTYTGMKIAENDDTEISIIKSDNVTCFLYMTDKKTMQYDFPKRYIIHWWKDLAIALWRFQNLGTIYA